MYYIMQKFGLFGIKKEMTQLWVDGAYVPVTLGQIPEQEVVRYKTQEKDKYEALVVGVGKSESDKEKGQKVSYGTMAEFVVSSDFSENHPAWSMIGVQTLDGIQSITLMSYGKGKGFQWGMKRFHLKGGNKTRGSKFHRWIGSMGNRKPRRTQKGHPHAGRMGNVHVTLKNISVVDTLAHNGQNFVAVKGSVPGSYNTMVKIVVS